MAEALHKLGAAPRLLTAIGDDRDGVTLARTVPGLLGEGCVVSGGRTAQYTAVLDRHGECRLGLGDMTIHQQLTPDVIQRNLDLVKAAPLIVVDGNVPQETMDYVLALAHRFDKPVFFEPTDLRKAGRPFTNKESVLAFASPNMNELRSIAESIDTSVNFNNSEKDSMSELRNLIPVVMDKVLCLIVTLGESGVLVAKRQNFCNDNSHCAEENHEKLKFTAHMYATPTLDNIVNVSGAGDCFASGFIYGVLCGFCEQLCVNVGFQTAKAALYSDTTVPNTVKICYDNEIIIPEPIKLF